MNAEWLTIAVLAAVKAGRSIMDIYQGADFGIEQKADRSPLTIADRASHQIIASELSKTVIPVLSEEGRHLPFEDRAAWSRLWMVDPLDGTKEFIKRNGEFTVNIALIENHRPVLGVIFVPVTGVLYFADQKMGAYMTEIFSSMDVLKNENTESKLSDIVGKATRLPRLEPGTSPYTIVGSRSHATPELEQFVEDKRREFNDVKFISAGSSLKICLVAEGTANIYPRLGPTMEWDTAAGHVIAECAGATVRQHGVDKPLTYNKENLLNPWFLISRNG